MSYALLIDDDPLIVERLTALIHDEGLEIETAASWEEGLDKFYAYSPDLVISDYNLPGSDMGLSLLWEISQVRPSVRLILFSAYLDENDADVLLKMGVVHRVIRKIDPIESAEGILDEVKQAAARASLPADWVQVAKASLRSGEVDKKAFERFDAFLQSHRLSDAGGSSE